MFRRAKLKAITQKDVRNVNIDYPLRRRELFVTSGTTW